jgi:hypothetical protein
MPPWNTCCKLRNAFAHSAESASLTDPAHSSRLAEVYVEARANPLRAPLETVLAAQPASPRSPLEPALRDYILLITAWCQHGSSSDRRPILWLRCRRQQHPGAARWI